MPSPYNIPLFSGASDASALRSYLNELINWMNLGWLVPIGLQLMYREKLVLVPGDAVIEAPYTQYLVDLTAPQALGFTLPDVSAWRAIYNSALPLLFKDGAGNAGTFNITVTAQAGQLIDGEPAWRIASDWGALALRPREDEAGWWIT